MASYTPNLNLLMKDPVADGADTFNIETMLNQNWEKIDRQVLLAMAAAAAYDAGTTYRKGDFCSRAGCCTGPIRTLRSRRHGPPDTGRPFPSRT